MNNQKQKRKIPVWVYWVGGFILLGQILALFEEEKTLTPKEKEVLIKQKKEKEIADQKREQEETVTRNKEDAYFISQEFVKQDLRAPSTAVFPLLSEVNTQHLEGNTYFVRAYVESSNSFGVQIRREFSCVVIKNGENWVLDRLVWL